MESDQPIHNTSPTKTRTRSPEKSSGNPTRKSPQKQDFQAASQAVEQEYDAVKRLKRLSIGNSLNFDPDLPSNDVFFSENSSNTHKSLEAHLSRSKSKLSKHSYQESDSDADESGYNDYDDYESGYGKISFHDSIEDVPLSHNDEIEFDDDNVDFLDLDPDSSFGDDNEIWVPATAHPKISPENFRKHIESRNQKLVQSSLQRGSSLKHVTKDLSDENSVTPLEQKTEFEDRKPSLRELSAQLESLTKKAGLEDDDAVTLARSLSKRSIGITKLEKEVYTRTEDETELDANSNDDSYPLNVRNVFLRNKANRSRESLFIKPDDDDNDTDLQINMDQDIGESSDNYMKHDIAEPVSKLARDKLLMMKKNNMSSNHVYNDIRRVHNAQRPLSKRQLEPLKTLTPTSKLPALPTTPISSSQQKQDGLSTNQRTLQNFSQQYQNHNQLQSPPTTPVKLGFNEIQQHQHQRIPHRSSPRYQQEYQQQSPQQLQSHQYQNQHQHQQIAQRTQQVYGNHPQQNSPRHQHQHQHHQPQYHQQYSPQQQLHYTGVDQRRAKRQQNQQLPPLQQNLQQQQLNFQHYQRQQYPQSYSSSPKLHTQQPHHQNNAPQSLPRQRSPKHGLEKSPIDQPLPDKRNDLPHQSNTPNNVASIKHSRNRYGSERNIVNLQNQLNTVENRRIVSDNVSYINKTSPQKEHTVPILQLNTNDMQDIKSTPESPLSDLPKEVEQLHLKISEETAVADQMIEEKIQKEKKSKTSFTSFFKLKRDKPRSQSTSEEPKSAFKNKRSFSHSSDSGSHSPKTDFKSFFGGKKEKDKKEKKVEVISDNIQSAKISTDHNAFVNERESTKSSEHKNISKSSPKLGIGLFMLNKSSENLLEKKEKRENKDPVGSIVDQTNVSKKETDIDSTFTTKKSSFDTSAEFAQKSSTVSFSNISPTSPTSSPKKIISEQTSPISSDDQESESLVDRVEIPGDLKSEEKIDECENNSQEVPDESNEIIKKSLKETLDQIERPTKPNQPLEMKDSAFGFPLPPVSNSTLIMLDHRFPVHVERAIYRLSHLKLADPKRALRQQVLLSNFMYSYLNLVNHTLWIQSKEQEETGLTGEVQQAITASELM